MKKTILITGAGGGLGKAISNLFVQNGFQVLETDISFDENIQSEAGIYKLKMDVGSETSVKNCAEWVEKQFGALDVLISNAGVFDFYALSESGGDKLKQIVDVNFFGLANLSKYFLPFLVKSKGRLLTIGSESYKIPAPFQPYAVSKQALEKLHFAIGQELMLKNVSSVLIRPGAIQTHIMNETVNFKIKNKHTLFYSEFQKFIASVPKYIGKIKQPEEVAALVFKAATVKNPKNIYKINHNPWVSLLAVLPRKIQDIIIKRQLRK